MSKKSKGSHKWGKKQIIIAVVVALLLVAAVGAGVLLQVLQNRDGTNGNSGSDDGSIAGLPQNSLPDSVQQVQKIAATSGIEESNKAIETEVAKTSDNDEKYALYLQEGANYMNLSQYDKAIEAYKRAEAAKQTWTIYKALGRAEESLGHKAEALAYYQKALPIMDKDDPMHFADKKHLEEQIKAVGG